MKIKLFVFTLALITLSICENTRAQDIPPSFQPCFNYLSSAAVQIFITKNITDNSLIQAINLSGRTWNDQGDIQGCLNSPNMTFVEVSVLTDGEVYRGVCLNEVCDYEILEENKLFIQSLSDEFKLGINMTHIKFSGSSPIYPPTDTAPFIIMVVFLSIFVILNLFAAGRYLFRNKFLKTNRIENSSTILNESQQNSEINKNKEKQKRESITSQILSTFNFLSNGQKLFTIKSNNDDLNVFNGIRSISFLQVILGHEFFLRLSYMSNYKDLIPITQSHTIFLFVANCLFSVDVFFLLGGFFISYVAADPKLLNNFNMKNPMKAITSYSFGIINRLFRILPCYFIALMIYWQVSPFLGNSPTWQNYLNHVEVCYDVWWQKLLLIDNLIKAKSKCFGWGWYLSNDFQMYLFSMLLIMIYATNRTAGKWSMAICILGFNAIGIWLSFKYNLLIPVTTVTFFDTIGDNYYFKPWARCPPYFFGLLFGIWYKEYQTDKINKTNYSFLSKYAQKIGHSFWKYASYILGLGIIFGLILIPRPIQQHGVDYWPHSFQNFWYGNMRLLYVIGVSFVCLPAICGSKDLIVQVLSCKLFGFLARLSFTGYLIHYIILAYTLWNSSDATYFSFFNLFSLFATESIFTMLAALVLHLLVEQPIMGLAALLFNKQRNDNQKRAESAFSINSRTLTQPFLKYNLENTQVISEQNQQSEIIFSEKEVQNKMKEKNEDES